MRTATIVKNVNPMPGISLSPLKRDLKLETWIGGPILKIKETGEAGKLPNLRNRLKTNCEKKRLLAKQNQRRNTSEVKSNAEDTPKFIIDYMPICSEEDLEMFALAMASEQRKMTD
ncbi:hypothetical protein J0A67_10285 [Algoriphagus aestuariicola]|uniref:Uncharacterized protein n=1 Tax=Algoriphagus aestuariicola TaxID=1852016 RepID=A0ABS3BPK9_9BACT|nr:hypothetical protein [Algoriphagus aestuariicola]MBN7801252.1 hypothetical protein [Algoriphagus aestuariicola]